MDRNLAFTVHATAHAFRAAISPNSCYDNRSDVRKLFDLWWFDKLYVEMDLMWFWR